VGQALGENRFFVVYCLANEELDLNDIEYSDLLLAASKVLVEEVSQQFPRDEKLLAQITKLIRKIVLASGGSLRELMRLIQEACLETTDEKIGARAVERAIVNVRAELTRPMPQGYFIELAKIHQSKQTDHTVDHRRILFYRYALEYNGERWVDVNPLIYDMPEFQRAIRSRSRAQGTRTKKTNG
jgi:hypothetical protein